jgi:hypothetical protein
MYYGWLMVMFSIVAVNFQYDTRGDEKRTGVVSIVILEKNRPETTVVISSIRHADEAHSCERQASFELSRYLQKMTGMALPVQAVEATTESSAGFWIGRIAELNGWISKKDLAECGPDGFVISVGSYGIAIAGGSPKGTLYGTYRILEDMDVQFFSTRIPRSSAPTLSYSFKKDRPFFDLRTVCSIPYGSGSPYDELGEPTALVDKVLYPTLWLDHTQGFLVPLHKYSSGHPEYYAHGDIASSIISWFVSPKANRVWLCMSNPDVRHLAGDTLLEWIKKQPDKRFFSVHGGDSSAYCHCANCQAVGNLSDNLVAFANVLAKRIKPEYPDKYLLIFAYQDTLEAPQRTKPDSNVIILYAPYVPPMVNSRIHSFLSGSMNRLARNSFEQWYKIAPQNMGVYEYNFSVYLPALDKMITQIREYARRGMRGVFYCGNSAMMFELFVYVNAKLLWDPFQDENMLITEFCNGFYGEGGKQMSELAQLVRTQVRAPGVSFSPNMEDLLASDSIRRIILDREMGKSFYTPEFRHKVSALVDQAEQAVRHDPVLMQRVRSVRNQFAGFL